MRENARRKARAGVELAAPGALVLGADTEVFLDGAALGKPPDKDAAAASLRRLSGRTHQVVSGVCLIDARTGQELDGAVHSLVTFVKLDQATLGLYLASEEWRGRAGGYAIQGLGSILIERLEGDFSNVVGLPIRLVMALVAEIGENPNPKV